MSRWHDFLLLIIAIWTTFAEAVTSQREIIGCQQTIQKISCHLVSLKRAPHPTFKGTLHPISFKRTLHPITSSRTLHLVCTNQRQISPQERINLVVVLFYECCQHPKCNSLRNTHFDLQLHYISLQSLFSLFRKHLDRRRALYSRWYSFGNLSIRLSVHNVLVGARLYVSVQYISTLCWIFSMSIYMAVHRPPLSFLTTSSPHSRHDNISNNFHLHNHKVTFQFERSISQLSFPNKQKRWVSSAVPADARLAERSASADITATSVTRVVTECARRCPQLMPNLRDRQTRRSRPHPPAEVRKLIALM
jgi:hypothetical protein